MPHRSAPSLPTHSTSRRRSAVAAALTAAGIAGLAQVQPASAAIIPGVGVAGVKVGDTQARVTQVLGTPDSSSTALNYRYIRSRGFGIYFIAGRVFEITVVRRPQATPQGIRVGSRLAALRRAHRGVACRPATVGRNSLECTLKGRLAGRGTETVFVTRNGTVTSIAVRFA